MKGRELKGRWEWESLCKWELLCKWEPLCKELKLRWDPLCLLLTASIRARRILILCFCGGAGGQREE